MKAKSLPIAVRAYAVPQSGNRKRRGKLNVSKAWEKPDFVLIFDVSASKGVSQKLRFGYFRIFEDKALIDQGFFYADDLPKKEGNKLKAHCTEHNAALLSAEIKLRCLSRHAFLKEVFYTIAFDVRGAIVGFDLPFAISRIAEGWSEGRKFYEGGFNFTLLTYLDEKGIRHPDSYSPRVSIKSLDSKRTFIGFTSVRKDVRSALPALRKYRCEFIDARTMSYAFSGEKFTLDETCFDFGLSTQIVTEPTNEFASLGKRVSQIGELNSELMHEFGKHPISLQPGHAFSAASIGKAYFRQMGLGIPPLRIQPNLKASRDYVLGWAMASYYGARAETRITKVEVPIVYLDFLSMYPTVNVLMGIWDFLKAKEIMAEDTTAQVVELLKNVTPEDLFAPSMWKELTVLVEVLPDEDILPMRAKFSDSPKAGLTLGLNYLTSDIPLWYSLADVIASKFLTGKTPKILRAIRFRPSGVRSNLKAVRIGGQIEFDPLTNDFYKSIVEERHRESQLSGKDSEAKRKQRFLKVLVNSMGYGVFGQLDRQDDEGREVQVFGIDHFNTIVDHPEKPGPLFCPYLATFSTSAARLMLALVETELVQRGGSFAFMDTDSIAVISTLRGGLVPVPGGKEIIDGKDAIRAISWWELGQIRRKFIRLNPYNPAIIPGSILRLEDENLRVESDPLQRPRAITLLCDFIKTVRAFQRKLRRVADKKI